MVLVVLPSSEAVADHAIELVSSAVKIKPTARIGFPTGKTPIPFFQKLVAKHNRGEVNLAHIRPCGMDEYAGVSPSHPSSFAAYMQTHIMNPLQLPSSAGLFLDGSAVDAEQECERFESELKCGGLDLVILGLGLNGHVAFNDPPTSAVSRTRLHQLSQMSIEAARADFPSDPVPTKALTAGLATIAEAKQAVVLVTGKSKQAILKRVLQGPQEDDCPASYLRDMAHVSFVVDSDAAAAL